MKRFELIAAAFALLLAQACAHSTSLPPTGASAGAQAPLGDAAVTARILPVRAAPESIGGGDAAGPCRHPQFPTICVRQGHSSALGIEITCTKNGKTVTCGTVTWTTKTSNKGLTASFEPNPGNPTTETVRATKTIRVGHYSQTITTKCSNVPNCPKDYLAPIYVLAS